MRRQRREGDLVGQLISFKEILLSSIYFSQDLSSLISKRFKQYLFYSVPSVPQCHSTHGWELNPNIQTNVVSPICKNFFREHLNTMIQCI